MEKLTKIEDETKFAEAQMLKAEQIATWFNKTMNNLDSYWKMRNIITSVFVDEKIIANIHALINKYESDPDYPFPWLKPGLIKTFKLIAYVQYNKFKKLKLNLTQTGLSMPDDVLFARRQRLGMRDNYFILGANPEGCCIVKGNKGSGKSEFVVQEIIRPAIDIKNILIVHNMALVDPVEKARTIATEAMLEDFVPDDDDMGPFKFDVGSIIGEKELPESWLVERKYLPDNAVRLDNCVYASNIADALRLIMSHALKGIRWTGKPYPTFWVVDEAGFSREKQRSMSDRVQMQKNITLLSRKLGCYEVSIYQLDDAPAELRAFATHNFNKPSRGNKTLCDSEINSTDFIEDCKVKGIMGWRQRKKEGIDYIEYGTWDIATLDTGFNVRAMLDYLNAQAKDGKPLRTEEQFERGIEFIDIVQMRRSDLGNRDEVIMFMHRLYHHYLRLYDNLKAKKRKSTKDKNLLKKYDALSSYSYMLLIAQAELPTEEWKDVNQIKREFDRIQKTFPGLLKGEHLPLKDEGREDSDGFVSELSGAVEAEA